MSEWLSVEERLPTDGVTVNVLLDTGIVGCAKHWGASSAVATWDEDSINGGNYIIWHRITHWCERNLPPLPDPPKESV